MTTTTEPKQINDNLCGVRANFFDTKIKIENPEIVGKSNLDVQGRLVPPLPKFERMVRKIQAELKSLNGGINPKDLPDLLRRHGEENRFIGWSCSPGDNGDNCSEFAAFFSLRKGDFRLEHKNHLSFSDAIEAIIQHWAKCPNTKNIVLITDNWSAKIFNTWESTLIKIQDEKVKIQIYLINGKKEVDIKWPKWY